MRRRVREAGHSINRNKSLGIPGRAIYSLNQRTADRPEGPVMNAYEAAALPWRELSVRWLPAGGGLAPPEAAV
ncbi:hypothetical protein Pve01_54970 [Planomonospora venezuelensis]|nr:hypothetical protein Pve01_54970 [Planomonospora venezuelensis]